MIASSQAATLRALASRLRTRVARSAHKSEVLELIDLLDVALVDTVAACTGCEPPGCGTCAPMPEPDLAPAPSPATALATPLAEPVDTAVTGGGACAPTVERLLELAAEAVIEADKARNAALGLEGWAARVRAACGGER